MTKNTKTFPRTKVIFNARICEKGGGGGRSTNIGTLDVIYKPVELKLDTKCFFKSQKQCLSNILIVQIFFEKIHKARFLAAKMVKMTLSEDQNFT